MSSMSGKEYTCTESYDGSHYISLTGELYGESQWCPKGLHCVSHEIVFLTQTKQAQVASRHFQLNPKFELGLCLGLV